MKQDESNILGVWYRKKAFIDKRDPTLVCDTWFPPVSVLGNESSTAEWEGVGGLV